MLAPHRKDREPTNDGWRTRRYAVERTFARVPPFRRVATRYEHQVGPYDGFVALARAFIAHSKL